MLFYIQYQLIQYRTGTNKSKHNLPAIGSFSTRFESLHNLDQILKVIVQTDIAGVHNDKLAIQTVLLLKSQNLLIILIQWIDFVLINPVVNHDCLRNFLSLETVLHRLHQITANCDYKVAAFAAELVKPHHGIGDKLALGVANSQHLLRIEVLNVVDVLGVFYPLAPNSQQATENRWLRNREHIIHLANLECRTHCPKEIGDNILHTALLVGFAEFWYSDSQYFYAIDFFFVILLRLVLVFDSS